VRRKAPQGHRREPFLRDFLGEQKVPRRRQNARRARKRGPQAQKKRFREAPPGRAKKNVLKNKPGPQAQEKTPPGGQKEPFPKRARAAGPKKTFSVSNQQPRPGGQKNPSPKKSPGRRPTKTFSFSRPPQRGTWKKFHSILLSPKTHCLGVGQGDTREVEQPERWRECSE